MDKLRSSGTENFVMSKSITLITVLLNKAVTYLCEYLEWIVLRFLMQLGGVAIRALRRHSNGRISSSLQPVQWTMVASQSNGEKLLFSFKQMIIKLSRCLNTKYCVSFSKFCQIDANSKCIKLFDHKITGLSWDRKWQIHFQEFGGFPKWKAQSFTFFINYTVNNLHQIELFSLYFWATYPFSCLFHSHGQPDGCRAHFRLALCHKLCVHQ